MEESELLESNNDVKRVMKCIYGQQYEPRMKLPQNSLQNVEASSKKGRFVELVKVEETVEPCSSDPSEVLIEEDKPDTTEANGECSSTCTISNQFLVEDFNFSISSLKLKKASNSETEMCRICHQDDLSEPNLSLCNCRGSVGLIHKSCLEQWLIASDSKMCELCGYGFRVKREPKYGFFRAIGVWLSSEDCQMDRLHVIRDIIHILSALPSIALINYQTSAILDYFDIDDMENLSSFYGILDFRKSLQECVTYFMSYWLVGTVTVLDMFSIAWIYLSFEGHYYRWRKWYRSQCIVKVVLPDQLDKAQSN